ncbi:cytoglobin-1-like isoform X1 [Numida meleagris]|uniref:cytoglobin-1-like isoform X1 n=1 Tax=Numida meleagris TaxID=8996 RepID=UPI000B3E35EE|nr:cytoglobin-1-like isoform X1 [Numida meleagris]
MDGKRTEMHGKDGSVLIKRGKGQQIPKTRPGTWIHIYIDASVCKLGQILFLNRMFTEHPDTKSYFTHFKGMDSAEDMKQSDQVRGHGKRVFTAINDMVQHLDNTEAFLGILNPLGQKHATQLKIDPKNFRIICDIILQLMEEKFGGDCKASFEKVTNEICTHLTNIYKEAGW